MAPIPATASDLLNSNILIPRQSASSGNGSTACPNSLSGGDIAGIVLGTIAGTLLILYLIKLCMLPGAPANPNGSNTTGQQMLPPSSSGAAGGYVIADPERRRRRRRRYREVEVPVTRGGRRGSSGSSYVVEKPIPARVSRSRSRRGSVIVVDED